MEIALSVGTRNQITLSAGMRQSMEILQLSSLDLYDYIQDRSSDNPLIDLAPGNTCGESWRKYRGSGAARSRNSDDWWLNADHAGYPGLEGILLEQLGQLNLSPVLRRLCEYIAGSLDDKGYLTQTPEAIADDKGISLDLARKALHIVQSLEPAGIAASSLEECLLLQLPPKEREQTLIARLISRELPQIAGGKWKALAKKYGAEPADVHEAAHRIASLNPKPGAAFGKERPQFAIPDLSMRNTNGTFEIFLEDDHLPSVSLNPLYSRMMADNGQPGEVSRYLRKKRQEARWIIQSLDFRKSMLLKICGAIFDKQRDFCERGPAAIHPLSMRIIADELNIHDSTVSRAVNHKYIMTPWGLFELKHFFSSSLKQADGDQVSALTAKESIKKVVQGEDKSAPLSDLKIAEKLRQEGILISRRTVAKYREQLHILPTAQRKRHDA